MDKHERFARQVFLGAAIHGVVVLAPQCFLEDMIGRDFPPALNHPEYFYGFIGVALTWQFVFGVIASDVIRFRPLMIPAILEKLSFGLASIVLYSQGRLSMLILGAGLVDLTLGALFTSAFYLTRNNRH